MHNYNSIHRFGYGQLSETEKKQNRFISYITKKSHQTDLQKNGAVYFFVFANLYLIYMKTNLHPSDNERKVLCRHLKFYSPPQISTELAIEPKTSRTYLSDLRRRFDFIYEIEIHENGLEFIISGTCRLVPLDDEAFGQKTILFPKDEQKIKG